MKVVYSWLKDFVDVAAAPEELASHLALCGTNNGGVENGPHGAVIDAEVTSNRPDCLGVYGIAREVSAIYKLPLKQVTPKFTESDTKVSDAIRVEIEAPELCGRFTARVIRGVKLQPSPTWLHERLEAAGVSSINNVVDATNYVMLELGHALHAFDYDTVRDHRIVVRRARPAEKMKTLDGIERTLDPGICMVADGNDARAISIGGIMGGAQTEISSTTKNVLIECAWFDPIAIRRATRLLRLHTEASTRFGRGADLELVDLASRRCAELIVQLAGGDLLNGVVDVYPGKRTPKKIQLTRAEILRVMGADVPDDKIESILTALGFSPARIDSNKSVKNSPLAQWECTQPSWRADAEREIDLIEEVARIYGFDKFPPRFPVVRQSTARLPHNEAEARLRERLIGLGYHEIISISHVAEERDALFRHADAQPARLANPLSEDMGLLRSTGVVTMAAALEWNLNHGQRNARLFEIGSQYRLNGGGSVETRVLTIGATGDAREKNLHEPARAFSFDDLKGDVDAIGSLASTQPGVSGLRWEQGGPEWLHSAKRARILLKKNELGIAGQLTRGIADKLKLRQDVFLAELQLGPLYCSYYGVKNARRYQALPRFPSVERDFSLLLADGTPFSDVRKTIQSLNIPEITSIEAADLFRGKNVPPGKYSLLVRVTLQSREATLTDAQIADYSSRIIAAIEKNLPAQLRAS